jgi:hypothetical protein
MPAIAANVLREGLLADYRDAYMETRRGSEPWVAEFMDLNGFSDGRTSTRGYFEAAPHPRYQPQGDPIHEEGMGSRNFTITNYPYSLRIGWHKDDREDDRTGSLRDMAGEGGAAHAGLFRRAALDLLGATTALLPATPNAADGTAVFSTSTRFGVSTGNSITVSSWSASGPAARAALWSGWEQFALFQDGKGFPLFKSDILNSKIIVLHAVEDTDILEEALLPGITAYAASTSNAGVENVLAAKRKFELYADQGVTSGTMYLKLTGPRVPPFIATPRTAIVESYADETNSDTSRNTGDEYVQWRQRLGFGVGIVPSLVRITAS